MDKIKELTTLEEAQVFSVPYRLKILNCMYSFKSPATVKSIADKMEETPAKIHYHIKKMEQVGIVQLKYTENVNGIIAKFYEPAAEYFQLSYNEGMDKDKSKLLIHAQKTIASLYDESKKNFLEQLTKSEKKRHAFVSDKDIYLTQEEFNEIRQELENILNKYSSNTPGENKNEYRAFFSLFESEWTMLKALP